MAARERTKAYNEQLKQRRKGEGTTATTTAKSRPSGPAKPWQTPKRTKKKKTIKEGDTGSNVVESVAHNAPAPAALATNTSSSDQAWYDEGGFGLPPVEQEENATAVVVQVLAARNLYGVPRAPDPEGMRDPFVSIEMVVDVPNVGKKAIHQRSSVKTSVKLSTLNPKFEESLGMALPKDVVLKHASTIIVRVEDNDRFNKQSFLGCVVYVGRIVFVVVLDCLYSLCTHPKITHTTFFLPFAQHAACLLTVLNVPPAHNGTIYYVIPNTANALFEDKCGFV